MFLVHEPSLKKVQYLYEMDTTRKFDNLSSSKIHSNEPLWQTQPSDYIAMVFWTYS